MARLCKKEELYNFKCGDYLLWKESREHHNLIPCEVEYPVKEIYISSPHPDYFYINGWEPINTYNIKWRIWERKPTLKECLMEAWSDE